VKLPAEPEVVRFDPEYTLLAKVKFDKSDKLLLAQLKNESDAIGRILACDELAKRKTKAVVKALRHALNNDPFFGVRSEAAAALRKIHTPEAVDALVESTVQPDARVRYRVAEELAQGYRDEASEKLMHIIDHEKNPAVIAAALRGLAHYQGKTASAAARKALASDTYNNEPVRSAFIVIRELNDPSLAADVMKTIKSRDAELDPRDVSEGMMTLAAISQRGRRREAAFQFLTDYLNHPRRTLRGSAIAALGELREPKARPLLEPIAAEPYNDRLAAVAKAALENLDKETRLVPAEVGELRREVRELRKGQDKLQKSVDELKAKTKAADAKRATAKSGK